MQIGIKKMDVCHGLRVLSYSLIKKKFNLRK